MIFIYFDQVWKEFFPSPPPRTTVEVGGLFSARSQSRDRRVGRPIQGATQSHCGQKNTYADGTLFPRHLN
jgi:hypothetical protein